MNINSNYGVYSLYNSMFQGNMSLYNNKLNKNLLPTNKAQEKNTLDTDAVGYVNKLKTASKDLGNAMKGLSGTAFNSKTVASSDEDAMSVSYKGNKAGSLDKMTVKIDQLATAQKNEGARMNATAAYGGEKGTNQFSIEAGGKTAQLSINVKAGDNNKDVQQKMADAINKAGIGVKASVETDSKTNVSMLKLESEKTGSDPKNGFSIKDTKGNLVAQTDAGAVSSKGKDAIYSVNGEASRTSQSNTVDLGNGVSATFKKESKDGVGISPVKDTENAKTAIESMVKSYNSLYSESAQRTDDPKAQRLAMNMANTSKAYMGSLSSVGIGFDKDGRMTIDKTRLDKAAENGKLEQFFTENSGRNYGFTNQMSKLANNVSNNTSNYVSSSVFGSKLSENFSYSNTGNTMQYNYLSAGSIFDFSF